MKIITLDLETSPHMGFHFGLFNQNFSLGQIEEWTRVICFAAKWYDSDEVLFYSDFHDGHGNMVQEAYDLLDQADVLVTYNGASFDVKHLNREFLLLEKAPPAAYQHIDLYQVNKRQFRFGSTKLDHLAQELGVGQKVKHEGFGLWLACLNGDIDAWNRMREYNKEDVRITENAFTKLRPWIPNAPNVNLYDETEHLCPRCGSEDLERRGFRYTGIAKYQRFQCRDCKGWSSSGKAEQISELRSA